MDRLEIEINQVAKYLEQTISDYSISGIQEHLNNISKIINQPITVKGKEKHNYIDAIYYSVIYYLDDMREAEETEKCEDLLKKVEDYVRNANKIVPKH